MRIRELVLGFQDRLLVPLAVVTGLAGADVAASTVVVGGLAEAVAGAQAMGSGAFLASQAENQLLRTQIADEEAELDDHPNVEREELEILLCDEGDRALYGCVSPVALHPCRRPMRMRCGQ